MSTEENRVPPARRCVRPSLQQGALFHVLAELLVLMASVETTSAQAKLNEVSMEDNNGGRIWF